MYRIKLMFSNGRKPLYSLVRFDEPTPDDISRGMKKHNADSYEIVEL